MHTLHTLYGLFTVDPVVADSIFGASAAGLKKTANLLTLLGGVLAVATILGVAWKTKGALGPIVATIATWVVVLFSIRYVILGGHGADTAEDTAKDIGMFVVNPDMIRAAVGLYFGA